ncbi:hypothetical protein EYC84_006528 [Monilinia fructicola]|uniref:Uncharacterized protein n=1 Tax=Monilinia fructicola TaxID=38448 RepID=A0A5M9K3P7_MONFR|nr:hypothetical protein EYC84_006528 [Monilinia fructicola]
MVKLEVGSSAPVVHVTSGLDGLLRWPGYKLNVFGWRFFRCEDIKPKYWRKHYLQYATALHPSEHEQHYIISLANLLLRRIVGP